jgi:transcriptional regulator with XRE-family HTH domain
LKYLAKNINFLRGLKGISQAEIADRLGFKRTTWNGYESATSKPYIDGLVIIADYFDVSEADLLHTDLSRKGEYLTQKGSKKKSTKGEHGSGFQGEFEGKKYPKNDKLSVLNDDGAGVYKMPQVITVDSQGNENVVMVPIRARAGYLGGYADPEFMQSLPAYRLPGLNNGTFRLFEVEGLSMYPTLQAGDLVIGSYVEQLGIVRDDRVHVVVTKNDGVVVKRVLNRIKTDGKLILKSDNYKDRDMFPPIVCEQQDVVEIWYATGFISRQMRPPAEMYTRLVDLEGRFTLLEASIKKKK